MSTFPFPAPNGTDQTAALQAIINAAPNGVLGNRTAFVFASGGDYRCEGELVVPARAHLYFDGNGAIIRRTALIGDIDPGPKVLELSQFAIRNSDDIEVEGLGVFSVGTGQFDHAFEGEMGFIVNGSRDVTLTDNIVDHPAGCHYDITWFQTPGLPPINSERVHVVGGSGTAAGLSDTGILGGARDCSISGVTFNLTSRSVCDMELTSASAVIDGFTFENNIITSVPGLGFIGGGGLGTHRNIFIRNNTLLTLQSKYGNPGTAGSGVLGTEMTPTFPGPGQTFELQRSLIGYPTGQHVISIQSELILCSGRVGTTETVEQRGYQGTVAAAHPIIIDAQGHANDAKYVITTPSRFNIVFDGNVASQPFAEGSATLLAFSRTEGVTVINNTQPVSAGTPTAYTSCTDITESGNSWNGVVLQVDITSSSLPSGQDTVAYSQTITATGGTTPYVFSLFAGSLPPGLLLSSAGVISGTPAVPLGGTYSFTVRCTDAAATADDQDFTIFVATLLPAIDTASLGPSEVGFPFSTQMQASGGIGPYTWSKTGSTPPGITLTTGGLLAGTPTLAGSYQMTFKVTDSLARIKTRKLTLVVYPPLVATVTGVTEATIGKLYGVHVSPAGGAPPFEITLESGSLPPGLDLDDVGFISGTPTQLGNFTFTVLVTDALSAQVLVTITITVAAETFGWESDIDVTTDWLPDTDVVTAWV